MVEEKKLWIRHLSCGCQRWTGLDFSIGVYEKPKVGDDCYCRNCMDNFIVIKVTEGAEQETELAQAYQNHFDKLASKK